MKLKLLASAAALIATTQTVWADCPNIDHNQLTNALKASIAPTGGPSNGGLDFHMWATVVAPDAVVCLVTKSGDGLNDQWLGSRIISAQKASTAVFFSLDNGLALSTANLYGTNQPGQSLWGLQFSNPVDFRKAYAGDSADFGTDEDPLEGERVGGVNVFGGGLPLYDENHKLVGALGVSGDTSCADHNVAWRVRHELGLDFVPAGVSADGNDNIIYDKNGKPRGFEHPNCGNNEKDVNKTLPSTR